MKKVSPTKLRITALLAFAALAVPAYSQVVKKSEAIPVEPATQPADAPVEEEDLVVLSPFEVTAKTDVGYQATQTLAGTRIRTDLKDVGSAISVYTKEFMRDIGASDSSTLLQYTPNAEVAGTRGTYAGLGNGTSLDETTTLRAPASAQRLRGLASADNTRDFFVTDIPWDGYNVDRIDVQRGPNSILFGLGSPAGIINAGLRNADFNNKGSVEARAGSYGSMRSSIDINRELIPGVLAIRLDALYDAQKYQQKPAFQNDKRLYGAIRFDPKLFSDRSFKTTVKMKFEHGDIKANRPRVTPPNDSITPWFRDAWVNAAGSTPSLADGMGKLSVNNGYELGSATTSASPWLGTVADQQQPIWFVDGTTNQLYRIYGGYVNTGARNSDGTLRSYTENIIGQKYSSTFYNLGTMSSYALNIKLPGYQYGQYRNASLTDPTVFDFYNKLIDGDTKKEFEKWNAYNIDLSQTAFDDRLAVNLSYDRQQYKRGGEALIPNPTISIDVLRNFQDLKANPNYSRPFVAAGPGYGNSTETDREYIRGSLFGELRSADFFDKNSLLVKILGKHRFTGVYSKEDYKVETRAWNMYGHTQAWDAYWNRNDGSTAGGRPPAAVIYLGQALGGYDSAHNADISGITTPVTYQDGNLYYFDSTWRPTTGVTVGFSDPWVALGSVPAALAPMFTTTTGGLPANQTALLQNSNPANYVGWGTNYAMSVNRYNNGENPSLLTGAARTFRITKSYAGSWQGYLWNESIVPTAGWRYDEVKSKGVTALPMNNQRSALNLGHDSVNPLNPTQKVYGYDYWDDYTTMPKDSNKSGSIFKDHSTSGGVVVHLNKILGKYDFLPINVSLSWNKSNNFQVTDTRRNVFGAVISNPTGSTKDYGLTLSTKDNKYSFRAIKYETALFNADSNLDASGLTGTIKNGMNWRNIILYQMSGYAWSTAGQGPSNTRGDWTPVYVDSTGRGVRPSNWATPDPSWHLQTQAESDTMRDNTIRAWNDIQVWLQSRGYFQAWNYGAGPTTASALTDRTTYLANPAAYTPDPASVYDYRNAPNLQGFKVTADTQSEGYEFELVANPLPNWRVAFNASKTTASRTNVGGKEIVELVNYLTNAMAGAAGDLRMFNAHFDDPTNVIWNNGTWTGFRGQYLLMKLQEGAAASELRKWRYNVVSNYSFTKGFLKGVGVGASYRWQDKVIIGYPVIPVTERDFSYDLANPYYGKAEDALDLWVSYERKLTSKLGWKIQLNIRNALKNDGLIPISVQPDGQTWAGVRTKPVQEWFVTNTLTF